MKKEVIDLRPRHDARAQELGFSDRHELRKAANEIADTMSAQEYIDLPSDEMERLLKMKAMEMKKTMKQIHVPQKIIPERNEVQFWETDYPDYLSFVGREVRLSEKVYTWLNENFSEWNVSFSTLEYVEWMAKVWRANHDRNSK